MLYDIAASNPLQTYRRLGRGLVSVPYGEPDNSCTRRTSAGDLERFGWEMAYA